MLQTKKEFVGLTFFINGVYKNTPELTQDDMKTLQMSMSPSILPVGGSLGSSLDRLWKGPITYYLAALWVRESDWKKLGQRYRQKHSIS